MKRPTTPEAFKCLRDYADCEDSTLAAVLKAHEELRKKFPGITADQITVSYCDGDLTLGFERRLDNPEYKEQMTAYQRDMILYYERNPDVAEHDREQDRYMRASMAGVLAGIQSGLLSEALKTALDIVDKEEKGESK